MDVSHLLLELLALFWAELVLQVLYVLHIRAGPRATTVSRILPLLARVRRAGALHASAMHALECRECYARVEAPDGRFSYKRVSIFCPNITPKRLGY
jgi:hypothetical protein